ncbi:MAG TPA: RNA polymerase sigma factor [Candidatus Saccharicenans sp.]|jgi:RNA polymerase sigma-70 factor (ECF subfamily)|nr:RNA polymerase sigma factor [Candidatus Saccharicenans sp.]HQO76587.1 RNA polymerase sigma factor [Candidatus Saccharicenans sp.]HUM79803.1 RNA polymerase sigma factor [Candidatus Saccharicenans sp.]
MTSLNKSLALDASPNENIRKNQASSWNDEEKREEAMENKDQAEDSNLEDLLGRSQQGQLEAMEGLYNLYKKKVFGLAYRLTRNQQVAEDLTQDIFLKIFSSIQDVRQAGLFPAWVYRLSVNTCYSYLRRERSLEQKLSLIAPEEENQIGQDYDPAARELAAAVQEALSYLPEKLRIVFVLHEVEGLTHEEIGAMLGCQPGTSKSQLFKARLKLRKILRKKRLLGGKKL